MSLSAILSFLAKPPRQAPSSASLRAKLEGLDVEALQSAVDTLEIARRKALISAATDDELAAIEAEIARADRAVERGRAAQSELQRLIEEAEQRESAAVLDEKRRHAEQLTATAIQAIEKTLPAAFASIRQVLRAIGEAEAACEAVNGALAADQHVEGPEAWRNRAARAGERIVSEREVTLWAFERSGDPLDETTARRVVDHGNGVGLLPPEGRYGAGIPIPPSAEVLRRKFRRIERTSAQFGDDLPPLASAITLPPLRAREHVQWDATPRYVSGEDLLAALDAAERQLREPFPEPRVEVVFVPIEPIVPRRAA